MQEALYFVMFECGDGEDRYLAMDKESGGYPVQTTTFYSAQLWRDLVELRDYVERYVKRDKLRFPAMNTIRYMQVDMKPAKCVPDAHDWTEWEVGQQSLEYRHCKICGERQVD